MEKNFKKSGWTFIDDPSLIFKTKPEMNVPEAYDKLLVDQLTGVLNQMGVDHQRLPKLPGRTWGLSYSGKKIKTKFAGPVSVLAHELGHQIGDLYGLYDYMTKGKHTIGRVHESGKLEGQPIKYEQTANRVAIKKEFQLLADLRREKMESVPKSFKKYLRKEAEKEAVILEAWLAAPEKMAKVAPLITAEWKNFLANNEDLKPLLNLDRSVVLGTRSEKLKMKGVLNIGQWALPDAAATILKRHLAPGLGSNKNIIIRNIYDGVRRLRNVSLGLSHAWSAFHGINVGTDSINTHFQVGLQKLARGDVGGAAKTWLGTPFAPFTDTFVTGKNLIDAMGQNIDDIADPNMKKMVQAIILAGGSASMDAAYKNNATQGLINSIRQVKFGKTVGDQAVGAVKAPFNAAMAITEKVSSLIMEYEVPRLKVACFSLMAEDIYEQANVHSWDDTRIQSELAGAWDNVDNRMGQLRYDNLNWNRTVKEIVMIAFRAPGWTLGSIREFGGGALDTATFWNRIGTDEDIITRRMGYAMGAGISYALQGMLIQYFLTGEPPEEVKDLYFPKTGHLNSDGSPERLSAPHYSKDIIAWCTQPVKTLTHKLNPLWGTAIDLVTNEDYFGRQIREGSLFDQTKQAAGYFLENMFMPFSVRNAMKLHENGETVEMATLIGGSGIAPAPAYITRSPAQKMMIGYLRDRGAQHNVSHADTEKSDRRREIVKSLRAGKSIPAEDWKGFTARQQKNIKDTAEMSPFRASYNRLSFDQAVNVFSISSSEERKQVFDVLVKRRKNKIDPDPTSLAMYYELKLTQAQADTQVKGDIQIVRNTAWQLTSRDISPARKAELLNAMRSNPQYEDDFKFIAAAFRHRWIFTLDGRRSGRKLGTKSYWRRLAQLRKVVDED